MASSFVRILWIKPSSDSKPRSGKKGGSAAKLESKISVRPKPLRWGMSQKEVTKVYAKVIDKDYLKKYQKAQPGVQMKQLDNEVAAKKLEFEQSVVEFGEIPTSLDGTPFAGEFTYKNRESVMSIDRKKKKRHRSLFFIRNRLWKIVDVYKLGTKSRYGTSFKSAVAKIEKLLGVKGRALKANPLLALEEQKDWSDGRTRLRLVNWDKNHIALIYEDESTAAKLKELRTYVPKAKKEGDDLDPSTKAILRK